MRALEWTRGILRRPDRGLRGLAVVAVAGLMLSACDWNVFRYIVGRTGFNNTESAISLSNVSSLTQLYTGSTGGAVVSSPAVANGVAYVGSGDGELHVYALPS